MKTIIYHTHPFALIVYGLLFGLLIGLLVSAMLQEPVTSWSEGTEQPVPGQMD